MLNIVIISNDFHRGNMGQLTLALMDVTFKQIQKYCFNPEDIPLIRKSSLVAQMIHSFSMMPVAPVSKKPGEIWSKQIKFIFMKQIQ